MGVSLAKTESVSFYPGMVRVLQTIAKMDAHHRLLLGFIVAALVGLALRTQALWMVSLATYDAFAFVILGSIWVTVTLTPLEQIRAVAQRQDVGRTVIFIFVIIVACAALFAVAFLIRSGKPEERHLFSIHLLEGPKRDSFFGNPTQVSAGPGTGSFASKPGTAAKGKWREAGKSMLRFVRICSRRAARSQQVLTGRS